MGDLQAWPPLANGGGFCEGFCHRLQPQTHPPTNPDLSSAISAENWRRAEQATREVLRCIQPTVVSEQRRKAVVEYVQELLKRCLCTEVCPFGSVPLKTYLPDGDIDLTALSFPNSEDALANDVRSVLELEEQNKGAEFEVKDVQYINAEVKLVKCIVENIVVDISFNQIGGLCTLCFLEKVDQKIGKDHLFKRSIILIKAWCYYESRILGAHHGLISTYALETLVLYVFHLFHKSLDGPLAVLYRFLDYYSKFDWDNYCVSLQGPMSISSLPELVVEPPETNGSDLLLSKEFIKECVDAFSVPPRFSENSRVFSKKHLNIVDPLKQNNNLGRSVSKGNFYRIRSAFTYGSRKLGRILQLRAEDIATEVSLFFTSTLERHGTGERPDVQDSSPSCLNSIVIEHNEVGSTSSDKELTLDSPVKASNGPLCEELNNIKISDFDEEYDTQLQFNRHNSNQHLDGLHNCTKMENCLMGGNVSVKHLDKDARDPASVEAFNLRTVDESCTVSSSNNQIGDLPSGKAYHAPHLFFHATNGSEDVMVDNVNSGDTAKKEVSLSRSRILGEETNCETESCGTSTSRFKTNSISVSAGSVHGSSTTNWNSNLTKYSNNADCSNDGNENSRSPKCSKLSDLTGDLNLHHMNLLCAQQTQCQEYFFNQCIVPVHGLSPSQYQNKHSWNGFHQQSIYTHIGANGLIPAPPFSPTACYPMNQSLTASVYGAKDIQKPRGTGMYFPNTNSRSYRERQSPGRSKNQMSPNQLSRSRNNGRLEAQQDRNLLEEGNNEPLSQPHSPVLSGNDRGRLALLDVPQSSRSPIRGISHGNGFVHHLEGKLEFGSLGPVKLRVSSPEQNSRAESVSPISQSSPAAILAATVQSPSVSLKCERPTRPYQLKDESDFPPLTG